MAFWDHFSKTIVEVAGNAGDKAKELGELAKVKADILRVQSKINNNFVELGKQVYEASKTDIDSPYADQCAKITGCYAEIDNLNSKAAIIKASKAKSKDESSEISDNFIEVDYSCPFCGAKNDFGAKFCSSCGKQL